MPFARPEAKKEYQSQYYQNNREKCIEAAKRSQKINPNRKSWTLNYYRNKRKERREWITTLKKQCKTCGESRIACLEFHHKNPKEKERAISAVLNCWSKKHLLEELQKCDVLCANCHRAHHWEENNL